MITHDDILHNIRHSLAHILAAAMQTSMKDVKLGVGPVIEHGFFYDFLIRRPLTEKDLPNIEQLMKNIIAQNLDFERKEITTTEAKEFFRTHEQPFKIELLEDIERYGTTQAQKIIELGEAPSARKRAASDIKTMVSLYQTGDFIDLCRGGHVHNTKELRSVAFKIERIAGAYWRGSEKNPQMQRVYALAFATQKELDEYVELQKEILKRDHRVLGAKLDLFSFHDIAPGAVFWHPNGMILWNELEKLIREELVNEGYQEIQTPLMVKPQLFKESGHLIHYKENMFHVRGRKGEEFYLKPMNCPESTYIYRTQIRSWHDLPLRYAEIGRIHRNELSGTLGGLFRVRQITQDDGHIYLRPDQIFEEFTALLEFAKRIYTIFKFEISCKLATRPDHAMGNPNMWEYAEKTLQKVLHNSGIPYEINPKDGAFYAPKIDMHIKDALGRDWQLTTLQLDIAMIPEKFNLFYIDQNGKKQKPLAIHRALYGSFERLIGILTEHYAGAFPVWLSPIQISILPVGKDHFVYSQKLGNEFTQEGIRTTVDTSRETVGYKIRKHETMKVPYMLVVGDKEKESSFLHIRIRGQKVIQKMAKRTFVKKVLKEIHTRVSSC